MASEKAGLGVSAKEEVAVGLEGSPGFGGDGFIVFGSIGTGVECGTRFKFSYAGRKGFPMIGGNVGWVGDNGVVGFVRSFAE